MSEELNIDFDDLTIDELEEIEDIIGEGVDTMTRAGAKKGKTLRALVYVVMRRDNPEFTLADAGKIKASALGGGEDPPTVAAD